MRRLVYRDVHAALDAAARGGRTHARASAAVEAVIEAGATYEPHMGDWYSLRDRAVTAALAAVPLPPKMHA